jgi:hypothetical protein
MAYTHACAKQNHQYFFFYKLMHYDLKNKRLCNYSVMLRQPVSDFRQIRFRQRNFLTKRCRNEMWLFELMSIKIMIDKSIMYNNIFFEKLTFIAKKTIKTFNWSCLRKQEISA